MLSTVWKWVVWLFMGLLLLTSGLGLLENVVLICTGQRMTPTPSVTAFCWVVSFTYFYKTFYWKRGNPERTGGGMMGFFASIFLVALLYMFAFLARAVLVNS